MNNMKNSVHLIGYLGQDPEIKKLDSGRALTKFSLATSDYYKNEKGEKVKSTEWHNIVAWGKTAELLGERLKKGNGIAIRGKLSYNTYEDKEGVSRHSTQIVVDDFAFMDSKS